MPWHISMSSFSVPSPRQSLNVLCPLHCLDMEWFFEALAIPSSLSQNTWGFSRVICLVLQKHFVSVSSKEGSWSDLCHRHCAHGLPLPLMTSPSQNNGLLSFFLYCSLVVLCLPIGIAQQLYVQRNQNHTLFEDSFWAVMINLKKQKKIYIKICLGSSTQDSTLAGRWGRGGESW